jgi:hypothetical protein
MPQAIATHPKMKTIAIKRETDIVHLLNGLSYAFLQGPIFIVRKPAGNIYHLSVQNVALECVFAGQVFLGDADKIP